MNVFFQVVHEIFGRESERRREGKGLRSPRRKFEQYGIDVGLHNQVKFSKNAKNIHNFDKQD